MKKLEASNSYKYLSSPSIESKIISPRVTIQIQQIAHDINTQCRLLTYLSKQHVQLLRKKLFQFRGTQNPINYQNKFGFRERWQKMVKQTDENSFNWFISSNKFSYFVSFFVMIHNFILVWLLSAFRLYQIRNLEAFFQIGIIFIIGDLFKKIYLYQDYHKSNSQILKLQKIILNFQFLIQIFSDLWCFIYYVCILGKTELGNLNNSCMLIFDCITIIILAKRAFQIYNSFVILIIATKYKNEMTIIDLVIKMMIILHFFSIILYGVAMTSPDSNWMTKLTMQDYQWSTRYIYTLYFSCTTIFTVGYGDIVPTNKKEIITIMVIQAIGMALFGYIVNQMGGALGNMRKRRANLQKDIFNAQRISNQFELTPHLAKKIREFVIGNQLTQQQLAINEQNQFLLKLNEDLRNEVQESYQLKIIKTCVFFIGNWSKKIQIQIAKKLQKCIFAPNQNLHTKNQVDRLFIMVKGKIQIYTQKNYGTKVCCRKLLKILQKFPKQEVFRNVYGFTSFFSGRPNRLKAVAKQSTICYTLGYENMKDSINQDSNDFQYFHELRQVFQFSKVPQKWQTPNIIDIRQSYNPVPYFVIKKHHREYKKQKRHNSYQRKDYKNIFILLTILRQESEDIHSVFIQNSQDSFSQTQTQNYSSPSNKCFQKQKNDHKITENQIQNFQMNTNQRKQVIVPQINFINSYGCNTLNSQKSPKMISNRSYWRKYQFKSKQGRYEQKAKAYLQQNIQLTSQFQIGKNYNKFFPKFNRTTILSKYSQKYNPMQIDKSFNNKQIFRRDGLIFTRGQTRGISQIVKDQNKITLILTGY